MGRLTVTATAPTQWTQTIINFLHHKILSFCLPHSEAALLPCSGFWGDNPALLLAQLRRDYHFSFNLFLTYFSYFYLFLVQIYGNKINIPNKKYL